jgi:hypothetical protein
VVIEERYAEGQMERLPDLFAELIRRKVDMLVAPGTVIARAAQEATTTIPIVAVMGDPVGTGLAGSLTGMSTSCIFTSRNIPRRSGQLSQYYHHWRTHRAPDMACPVQCPIQRTEVGLIKKVPEVGGSHHHYEQQAA